MCCSMINGRSFGRDEWRRGGKTTETPFPTTEISEGCAQTFGAEIFDAMPMAKEKMIAA